MRPSELGLSEVMEEVMDGVADLLGDRPITLADRVLQEMVQLLTAHAHSDRAGMIIVADRYASATLSGLAGALIGHRVHRTGLLVGRRCTFLSLSPGRAGTKKCQHQHQYE